MPLTHTCACAPACQRLEEYQFTSGHLNNSQLRCRDHDIGHYITIFWRQLFPEPHNTLLQDTLCMYHVHNAISSTVYLSVFLHFKVRRQWSLKLIIQTTELSWYIISFFRQNEVTLWDNIMYVYCIPQNLLHFLYYVWRWYIWFLSTLNVKKNSIYLFNRLFVLCKWTCYMIHIKHSE